MSTPQPDVAVIGAGTAGLAAAVALARDGARVTLLERRPFIGGRAYSYPHPALAETIDSQHVILGCCTNFLNLVDQALVDQARAAQASAPSIRWYDTLTFLQPQTRVPHVRDTVSTMGIESRIHPSPLPAPFHNSIAFLRAPMLTLRDKAAIAAGLARFLHGPPADDTESFAAWLRRTHQTDRAIRHFWEPIVAGALNDTFDRCSTRYAGKVFYESFLRNSHGGRLGIPAAPLSDFFAPILAHARALGVDVRLNSPAHALTRTPDARWRITSGPNQIEAGAVILATNLRDAHRLLTALDPAAPAPFDPEQFVSAPITTIHLWYDREITTLDHAVLLDTRIQWMFHKSRIRRQNPGAPFMTRSSRHERESSPSDNRSYIELVISASWPELQLSREDILASALREAELFFPAIRQAQLLKSAVLKEARATFSVTPGLDAHRPAQTTAHPNLYLAGDWTATDWPSTMEGAIRSGRLAAGALTGNPTRFLTPDLPPTGLMRLL